MTEGCLEMQNLMEMPYVSKFIIFSRFLFLQNKRNIAWLAYGWMPGHPGY